MIGLLLGRPAHRPIGFSDGVVGVAVVVVCAAVGVTDVLGHKQQSSEESKLGNVVLSQPSLTHIISPEARNHPKISIDASLT